MKMQSKQLKAAIFWVVIIIIGVMLFVSGCGRPASNSNPVYLGDNSNSITSTFSAARISHSSVVFDSKLWIIGGCGTGGMKNDVWSSSDGVDWTRSTAAALFQARVYHSSVTFDNKIWVIGGFTSDGYKNDVWYSSDGISWTCATAEAGFSGRRGQSSVVLDNKIWVIGGYDSTGYKNDVWYSSNGVNWTRATSNAGFAARFGQSSVVSDSKMWVIGGCANGVYKSDVWYSSDGVSWTCATSNAGFDPRRGHGSTVFDSKIWVIGGRDDTGYNRSSSNGVNWTRATDSAYFSARRGHTVLTLGTYMYVVGGQDGNEYRSDVWRSSDGTNWDRQTVAKLCFIHHTCGGNWISSSNGGLGTALNNNHYYVTETDYGWSAAAGDNLGSFTDINNWGVWFTDSKMSYVYNNSSHYDYNNAISDPGGENEIVIFKSGYANSEVGSSIETEEAYYNALLPYFYAHPEKLFILVTPPGDSSVSSYLKTKELCDWLVDTSSGWLKDYHRSNVVVYDLYCTLSETNSHHRIVSGSVERTYAGDYDGVSPYHSSDNHPNATGNQKATTEFVPLLNYYYSRWKAEITAEHGSMPPPTPSSTPTVSLPTTVSTSAWPGETWQSSTILTGLDPTGFNSNMSSATWNPETRMFWVCRNGGPSAFWALDEDGVGSLKIATSGGVQAKFVTSEAVNHGDFEGICQVNYDESNVYVIDERVGIIKKYDVSVYGHYPVWIRQWDISANIPAYDGSQGPEGITFVPDEWLSYWDFVDGSGNPYPSSVNGMGGLMFIAHQNGGRVYVFDLDPNSSTKTFVGAYKTRQIESSDLEFDRSNGHLYVWHNTGSNYLEVTTLSSYVSGGERHLATLAEFVAPKTGNLEGFGFQPASDPNHWCLITDDDNQNGAALMLFKNFNPGL
ncbi:MAG: hypothetical protein NT099_10180 [Candidatus Saganbacteria bacterium]|nr:hypothetical protein [Candidatus Saganbacteria bacterium]